MKKVLLLVSAILVVVLLSACEYVDESVKAETGKETVSNTDENVLSTSKKDSGEAQTAEETSTKDNNEEKVESGEVVEMEKKADRYKDVKQNPVVTMTMSDGGVVKMELYPQIAPTTVENFISLINKGFYDGVIFHRVIPGFMAQGGDPLGNGTGGPGYYIEGEFSSNDFEQNNLKHDVGVLSMARATPPNSAGSQFFIVTGDQAYLSLDGLYAGFGKVIEGMDYIYEIVNSPVKYSSNDFNKVYEKLMVGEELTNDEKILLQAYQNGEAFDRPITPPVIKSMTVETFGVTYAEPEKIVSF